MIFLQKGYMLFTINITDRDDCTDKIYPRRFGVFINIINFNTL